MKIKTYYLFLDIYFIIITAPDHKKKKTKQNQSNNVNNYNCYDYNIS